MIVYVVILGAFLATPVAASNRPSLVADVTLGRSTEGRPITAVRIGTGSRKLVLVGDTHGGPEANTYRLMLDLIDHFRAAPQEIPSTIRLYIIPTLNPDGLAHNSRFNARGVDLNRNMKTSLDPCPENDWRPTVQGAYGIVSDTGGTAPETEVESQLIKTFLLDASAAIFYHSAGGELFPPYCEHSPSIKLAEQYARAGGYTYTRYYPRYMITGGMHDWAGSLGIASFTPELWTGEGSDTPANHAALHAIFAQADTLMPLPEDVIEHGIVIPAIVWRFWQSQGGAERLGTPLTPPHYEGDIVVQLFTNAEIRVDIASMDVLPYAHLTPLGNEFQTALAGRLLDHATTEAYTTVFATAAEQMGGEATLGTPLTSITAGLSLTTGAPRVVQLFTRARLELDSAAPKASVTLSPLGWYVLQRMALQSPSAMQQIR